MPSSVYVTTPEAHCGKSLLCLGIMENVLRRTQRVGIFRPIISGDARSQEVERDKNIDLLLTHFRLDQPYESTYAYHKREARELLANGRYDELLDTIIEKYKAVERECDFVLCEGTDFTDEAAAFDVNINVDIVKNLGCPVLILGRGDLDRSLDDVLSPLQLTYDTFRERECPILGLVVNRAQPAMAHELLLALRNALPDKDLLLSVIPQNEVLQSPTVREIAEALDAEVLYGHEQLDRQARRYSVAAMQLQNYLPHLTENCLVITPGDRGDILLSVLQAHQSDNYPAIAGVLLTTQLNPDEPIRQLLEGLPNLVPILSVSANTYNTAFQLSQINSYVTADNDAKIQLSKQLFDKYVDTTVLAEKISTVRQRGITPRMFQYTLVQQARESKKHIVLCEGTDERILRAAEILLDQGVVDLTVLGKEAEVRSLIQKLGLRLDADRLPVVNPGESPHFAAYVDRFVELRQHKGANADIARDTLTDVSYFGTMMVLEGQADGMVSGAAHTTQHTIRPALQLIKTTPDVSLVSSVFFMALEDRVLVYGDCAINPNPDAQELAEIAISSAETSRTFGIEPKIALLSYSSGTSGAGADVEKVREATQIVKERRPDLKTEGPIQYDAAVDAEVGVKKVPGSEVAGYATVLIFPDLNTGNNTYKAVQRETGAVAIGPVLQGLKKPVNDLSRGCTVTDIVNTVVITAIQAGQGITK